MSTDTGVDGWRVDAVIGNAGSGSEDVFEVLDPASGKPFAAVDRCNADDVDAAVEAARHAFETTWRHTTPAERSALIRRLVDLIRRDREVLARIESRDVGKPISQARVDADVAARYFEFYAHAIETFHGDVLPDPGGMTAFTRPEPLGVTAHILPWNYPLQMGARSLAPALAAGNCTVTKPAEDAPLSLLHLARLAQEAGFPSGAVNVVPGFGAEAGAALAGHRGIDHLSFTGSLGIGSMVATAAAANVVPVLLELGGKNPNVVFADADLEAALPVLTNGFIQNAGQTCSAATRLVVHDRVHDQVVERLLERLSALRIGSGISDADLGPLVSARQRDRVAGIVREAATASKLVHGGCAVEVADSPGGFFFAPTVFDEVDPDAPIAQQEVFGPVVAVSRFSDIDEAIAIANNSDYGLTAGVWTADLNVAHRAIRELRVGQVYVNTYGAGAGVELPFGGVKKSGYGREKGFEALRTYSQTKTVVLNVGWRVQ